MIVELSSTRSLKESREFEIVCLLLEVDSTTVKDTPSPPSALIGADDDKRTIPARELHRLRLFPAAFALKSSSALIPTRPVKTGNC